MKQYSAGLVNPEILLQVTTHIMRNVKAVSLAFNRGTQGKNVYFVSFFQDFLRAYLCKQVDLFGVLAENLDRRKFKETG